MAGGSDHDQNLFGLFNFQNQYQAMAFFTEISLQKLRM